LLQNSLFKNLPKLDEGVRERNKQIREKTKRQTSSSTGPTTVRSANKLHQTIQLIKQKASERLKAEEGKYLLIRDEASLVDYVDKIIEVGIAGLDTETTGLDTIVEHLVGTCLYAPGLKGSYIPHKHIDTSGALVPDQIPYDIMAREMQRMVDAGVKFVLHNAKFDLRVVVNWLGVWFKPYWCTNIASNFLNENEPHGLKALHDKYVARNTDEDKELNTFNSLFEGVQFNYIPIEIGYLYAAKDPVITFELYEFQLPYLTPGTPECERQGLEKAAKLFLETEMPLVYYLAEMEQEGVYINEEFAKTLSDEYRTKMKDSAVKANEILKGLDYTSLPQAKKAKLGGPIEVGDEEIPALLNIGSPTQLAIVFYDLLGMKSPDKDKPRGTGEEILEALAARAEDPTIKELMTHILDFRGYKKMLSTYVDKMPAIVKEKTGRLHGSFNQMGAKTGRMSSSDPNLLNEGLMLVTA
jgi:DNA polymerase-1